MKIYLKALEETAKNRPEGYYNDVVSSGKVVGNYLEIEPPEYKKLLQKYNAQPNETIQKRSCCGNNNNVNVSASFPPISEQMKNALGAGARLLNATIRGQPVHASKEEVTRREGICNTCQFYDAQSKRCKKCGCYLKVKIHLETEHCPISNW